MTCYTTSDIALVVGSCRILGKECPQQPKFPGDRSTEGYVSWLARASHLFLACHQLKSPGFRRQAKHIQCAVWTRNTRSYTEAFTLYDSGSRRIPAPLADTGVRYRLSARSPGQSAWCSSIKPDKLSLNLLEVEGSSPDSLLSTTVTSQAPR